MRKILLALAAFLVLSGPAGANEKTKAFEDFMLDPEHNSEMASMPIVETLNRYAREGKSVDQLLDDPDFTPAYDSETAPLILKNFKWFLSSLKAKGYGTARFERWNMMFVKGWCGEKAVVFYSPLKHGGKTVTYGFHFSPGDSLVRPDEISRKALDPGCD